ncbi:MAG: hypothetical protein M1444_01445 [Patescibacteria group bacterium]|nr:hypothetical protein [Patescibacteria group bacterium]
MIKLKEFLIKSKFQMLKTLKHSLKIKNLKFKILLIILISVILNLKSMPFAQAQPPQKGITVSPSIAHIDLATDPAEYELTYVNNTNTEINLLLSVKDFTQLEDSYKISFLEGKDAANYKYSLSSWISFENKTIQLSPNEKKSVKVFIDKERITKGGHYASILAEIVQPEIKHQVNVKAILSSLLFVRASTGKEIEEGKISSFKPVRSRVEYPERYLLRFENSGNVHVIPYGLIEVFDPLGNLAAKGIVNEGSLDALPESIRRYDTKVTTYQKVLLPGIYTAKIQIHFGKTNQKLSSEVKFFSQGMFDFVRIGLIIAGIVVLLIVYKRKRNFNNSAM